MKIIDLINIVASGKTPPRRIKVLTGTLKEKYRVWIWEGLWYVYEEDGHDVSVCIDKLELNDKIKILDK